MLGLKNKTKGKETNVVVENNKVVETAEVLIVNERKLTCIWVWESGFTYRMFSKHLGSRIFKLWMEKTFT